MRPTIADILERALLLSKGAEIRELLVEAIARVRASHPINAAHGSTAMYRRGCRCDNCKAAKTARQTERLTDRLLNHGTTTAYRSGCRCDLCKSAKAAATRAGGIK